jgi:hypothetical protein
MSPQDALITIGFAVWFVMMVLLFKDVGRPPRKAKKQ